MTCRTYTRPELIFHIGYIIFLSICGVLTTISSFFSFHDITCMEDAVSAYFTTSFSLLIIAVDFFECRAMGARIYMDESGIGVRRFGRTKVFIKWNDIKEIGIGKLQTAFGSKEHVYFCDRNLDEKEKSDLVTLQYDTIHLAYIPKDWYNIMCGWMPVPVAREIVEKYVR